MTDLAVLHGQRVLVVEDELLVAMLIEDVLADQGCVVVGPYANLQDALQVAGEIAIDLAVLDVNLRGEKVYPLADILAQRGIPFILLSGYGQDAIPADRPRWRACSKPFRGNDLIRTLVQQLVTAHDPSSGSAYGLT